MKDISQIHRILSNVLSSVARHSTNYPPSKGPAPRVEEKPAVTPDHGNLSIFWAQSWSLFVDWF